MFLKHAPKAFSSFQGLSNLIFVLLLMLLVSVAFPGSSRKLARAALFSLLFVALKNVTMAALLQSPERQSQH